MHDDLDELDELGQGAGMADPHELAESPLDEATEEAQAVASAASALVEQLSLRLKGEYDRRRGQRSEIEKRWRSDIEQYNSQYDAATQAAFKERQFGSQVFVPLTRRICNIVEARWGDLLFPTDDRNFVVQESPIPDLADAEELAKKLPPDAMVDAGGAQVPAGQLIKALRDVREEAKRKAANMQRKVDDQLKEANYPIEARKAIHDAIKLGTGVLKGPFALARRKTVWKYDAAAGRMVRHVIEDVTATVKRVDPWNFYPQLGVSEVDESADFFEKHRMNMAELAALARQPGFDPAAIAAIIEGKVIGTQVRDENLDVQREAAGTVGVDDDRFNLIEYTGPVLTEELRACGCEMADDPLMSYMAVVWFSEFTGHVVKAMLYPVEAGNQRPYRVLNWQRDSSCIFGYGLPYEIRDTQEAANSAFRAAMDNMGLSVGPQLVINDKKIVPANGRWAVEPNKVWRLQDASVPVTNVFAFNQVESRVSELLSVFNAAKALAEEIGGPAMAMQGTEAPSYAQAGATGMAIAYNAANIWMRRAVKNYDDQITVPLVSGFIDWNMEFSDDDDIKGDVNAVARGTSALLEAEGQVQRLQVLMGMSQQAGIPIRKMVNQLRQMALAMRLDPDDLLPNDDEVKQMEEQQAQNGPPPNPELERLKLRQAEMQDAQAQREHEMAMAQQANQIRVAELAAKEKLTIEQVRAKYGIEEMRLAAQVADKREQRAHDARKTNAELAVKATMGSGI
ncbi:MAG: hypothetical protein HY856_13560 [Burkholderiales bacterium]|nr:hypothetical protein [Burkholderiales bacterium]